MADRFWVGAGTWNSSNTANWSTTSGGSGGASIPLATDDVYFDANSGNCTVATNVRSCNNLSFIGTSGLSNYTATFTLNIALNVGGGLILSPSMTLGNTGFAFNFNGSGTYNIVSNGKTVTTNLSFNNVGTWNFTDSFIITRVLTVALGTINFTTNATLFTLTINNSLGTVNMNAGTITSSGNVNLSAGTLNINSPVSLANVGGVGILLSSTGILNINDDTATNRVTVTGGSSFTIASGKTLSISGSSGTATGTTASFDIQTNPTTSSFSNSIIKFTNTSNNSVVFAGNGLSYGTIWFSRGGVSTGQNRITSSNTISTIKDDGTKAHNLRFTDNSTQTITTSFEVNGIGITERIVLNSIGTVNTFNLDYIGTAIRLECTYLNIINSIATPRKRFYASESIIGANTTGWNDPKGSLGLFGVG